MYYKFIKGKAKKAIAFSLALLLAGMSTAPTVAYAQATKGYYGKEVKITHESKTRYVADATFYDYYSDSQVNSSSTPGKITDAKASAKTIGAINTFQKFNNVLLKTMKYGEPEKTPTKYPLYQGYFSYLMTKEQTGGIFSAVSDKVNTTSNFYLGANGGQGKAAATQGLVDSKLQYDQKGQSVITTTNKSNGMSAKLPYFNKDLLTSTRFDNSQLAIGDVKENVSFPFRQSVEGGVTYYEFDSSKDVVRFNKDGELQYMGTDASQRVKDTKGNAGFFPYNEAKDSNSNNLNFGFGTKIEIPFTVTEDGKIDGQDIVFEFSGDDDVWVYIDDTLAMDLGGGHEVVSGKINLAKGKTEVSMVKNNSVAFSSRNKAVCSGITRSISSLVSLKTLAGSKTKLKKNLGKEIKTKLKDTSKVHYLTLFYLERGEWQSNMKMKFNLPEPNNITVVNNVSTSGVNKVFKDEASKIAQLDEFMVSIVDKNLNEYDEQSLLNKQYVSYTDEFKYNDTMQVKLNGLKNTARKIENLYTTSYELTDAKETIANGKSAIIADNRAKTTDSIIFKNKNNTTTPFLLANYTNSVATGQLVINNAVNKVANKDDKFEYTVVYSEVFGGESKAVYYNGEYTIEKENGNKVSKKAKDGKILLGANEKAIIKGIPAQTKVAVQQQSLKDVYYVETIDTTDNFKSDEEKLLAVGCIEKSNSKNDNNEVIFAINAKGTQNSFDDTPETADKATILFYIMNIIAIVGVVGIIGAYLYNKKNTSDSDK